jgi:hypothetical protein
MQEACSLEGKRNFNDGLLLFWAVGGVSAAEAMHV